MPPGWGGGTGGGGGDGDAGAGRKGGGGRGVKDLQSREEIRKFLNFYKWKNSVCVDSRLGWKLPGCTNGI